MALAIFWSPRSRKNFDSVIAYLEKDWTERETRNFVKQVSKILFNISESPYLYKPLPGKNLIRQAIITKHNLLLYQIANNRIELLAIFDTRQHPFKKNL